MKMRWIFVALGAVVLLGAIRKLWVWHASEEARAHELHITHVVDLADLADPTPKVVAAAAPPARTTPVLVELTFVQPGAKRPFVGHYQVLDNNGLVFTEGDAPADGSSVALVLSPSNYEVHAGKNFKQVLALRHAVGEKQALKIVVPR